MFKADRDGTKFRYAFEGVQERFYEFVRERASEWLWLWVDDEDGEANKTALREEV